MGAFFILYNLSMFISRFARTITSFPHFKCREMALFHIVCYFKLFSLFILLFPAQPRADNITIFDVMKKTE